MDSLQAMRNFSTLFKDFDVRLNVNPEIYLSTNALLSKKYQEISSEALHLMSENKFTHREIRTWAMQDDMGVPVQIRRLINFDQFFFENLLRYLRNLLPSRWLGVYFQKSALIDDLEILVASGAGDILTENPVDSTPFVRDIYNYRKYKFNSRYLRYVYLANQIQKYSLLASDKEQTFVDVGNFYGGLQGLLKKRYQKTTFISVELPHQLFRSFLYHSKLFPNAKKVVGLNEYKIYMSKSKREPAFVYLHPSSFDEIGKHAEIDLLSNYLSFGEMSDENFNHYFHSITFTKTKKFHFVNRFISSPSIDQTFQSKIKLPDYLISGTSVIMLDIFPIHHYSITKRKFLGRTSYRNASSPQFELILERP